ncbi:MAG: NAD(P)H-dependent glycerol-3-phosphate dehydrogenase [Gammaproteobacteria bacterium]
MKNVAVMGLGNFGTALACNWLAEGLNVSGWTVEEEVYDSIQATGVNEKYLDNVSLEGLNVSMDIAQSVVDAEIIVLALPSHVVLSVVDDLLPHLRDDQILLDLAKGLAPGDQMISEVISQRLEAANLNCRLCVMMGPTIAPELARGVYTTALVTSDDVILAGELATILTTKTLKLSAATDSLGSEYWGAFKNVIALACGVVDGLKKDGRGGDNLKAALFTSGYREAVRVLPLMGADPETALSAAGIGDLFVTATSPHGRNREMGERLGMGQTLKEAESEMVMVSEGVRAARMFKNLFSDKGIEAPFVDAVCVLLNEGTSIEEFIEQAIG